MIYKNTAKTKRGAAAAIQDGGRPEVELVMCHALRSRDCLVLLSECFDDSPPPCCWDVFSAFRATTELEFPVWWVDTGLSHGTVITTANDQVTGLQTKAVVRRAVPHRPQRHTAAAGGQGGDPLVIVHPGTFCNPATLNFDFRVKPSQCRP